MSIGYLDILDELLAAGTTAFSQLFIERQVNFVTVMQLPDGGFPGRRGPADLYYTDFALRILALFAPDSSATSAAGAYLTHAAYQPDDLVAWFNLLHAQRLLRKCNVAVPLDTHAIVARLGAFQQPDGGFTRYHGQAVGAYATFLAALCYEMLDIALPDPAGALRTLNTLQCPDGGYGDLPGAMTGQTNATAAATAVLVMRDALDEPTAQTVTRFLLRMQAADGGFLAHREAPCSDLLSTFTACMTLSAFDALAQVDLSALARFIRQVAMHDGGFRAGILDEEADIEYTYYGIGTLALLRAHVAQHSGG